MEAVASEFRRNRLLLVGIVSGDYFTNSLRVEPAARTM